jgi:hypothetical protein
MSAAIDSDWGTPGKTTFLSRTWNRFRSLTLKRWSIFHVRVIALIVEIGSQKVIDNYYKFKGVRSRVYGCKSMSEKCGTAETNKHVSIGHVRKMNNRYKHPDSVFQFMSDGMITSVSRRRSDGSNFSATIYPAYVGYSTIWHLIFRPYQEIQSQNWHAMGLT